MIFCWTGSMHPRWIFVLNSTDQIYSLAVWNKLQFSGMLHMEIISNLSISSFSFFIDYSMVSVSEVWKNVEECWLLGKFCVLAFYWFAMLTLLLPKYVNTNVPVIKLCEMMMTFLNKTKQWMCIFISIWESKVSIKNSSLDWWKVSHWIFE